MADDKTYNGWTNYETWSVALLINNDEGSQDRWRDEAKGCYRVAQADKFFPEILGKRTVAKRDLADQIKADHEENNPLADDTSIYAQLLQGAMSDVNWGEIADSILDDDMVKELDAEEPEDEDEDTEDEPAE